MGKRGPPPMPTHLKLLRGNPGKQAINRDEPQPLITEELPEPPTFLAPHAQEEWRRMVGELHRMKLLTIVDIHPLAAYCQSYARWRAAEEALARLAERDPVNAGLIIKTTNGNAIENPLVTMAHRAARDMCRYAGEFGFTPAARSRIAVSDSADRIAPTASKFAGLLAG